MAKEAVLQVRIDAEIKREVEELYRNMGTTFAEAVRIFAKQSIAMQSMPFIVRNDASEMRGTFAQYANPELITKEKDAFRNAMVKKHANID